LARSHDLTARSSFQLFSSTLGCGWKHGNSGAVVR
jgi:hypothetical protein